MINGISGVSYMTGVLSVQPYKGAQQYMGYAQVKALSRSTVGERTSMVAGARGNQGMKASPASAAQPSQKIGAVWQGRSSSPGTPVEPVDPVKAVTSQSTRGIAYAIPFLRKGMDPAELSVRMRMRYMDPAKTGTGQESAGTIGVKTAGVGLPGAEPAGREAAGAVGLESAGRGMEGVQKASGEKECQTCKERKYQDGSDDPGVSYQTPTHIAPEQAASAVRGHEMEHVVRERASAERDDRRVVSQSVTMHTAICPECGRVYVSGGTTRTTTASDAQPEQPAADESVKEGFGAAA